MATTKLASLAGLLAFTSVAVCFQTQDTTPLVRSESRLVLLDVVVTGKNGHPITGLTKGDFTVLENGAPQKILSFTSQTNNVPQASRPRTVLLLDQLNTSSADLAYALDSVRTYLEKHPAAQQPTALMAVGTHGLVMLQNFTDDNLVIRDQLKHLSAVAVNPTDGYLNPSKSKEHVQDVLNALTQIARASVGSSSSVNVVWFTSGFSGVLQGLNSSQDVEAGLRNVANLLMQSRMRLYSINPAGVLPFGPPPTVRESSRPADNRIKPQSATAQSAGSVQGQYYQADQILDRLTNMMGGKSYFRRNDVDVALSEAILDGASAYLISYVPSNTNFDGGYRKIEVLTKLEGSTARTRHGYYAVAVQPVLDPEAKETRLRAALASPLLYAGWNLTCPHNFDSSSGRLTGLLKVTPNPLVREEEQTGQILRAESFSKDGKMLDNWSWRITWKTSWTNRAVSATFDKVLDRKARTVRFLVSDFAIDRIGTCEHRIE